MHAESCQSNSVIQTVRHAIQLLVAQMSVAQTSGNCLSDVCMCMFVFVSIMLQCGAKRLSKYTYMLKSIGVIVCRPNVQGVLFKCLLPGYFC